MSTQKQDKLRKQGLLYDIQLLIIDAVAEDSEFSTLKSLALTHRALRLPCQVHIFYTVNYKDNIAVLRALKSSPHLASHIRALIIYTDSLQGSFAKAGKSFMRKLTNVQDLSIYTPDNDFVVS